MEYGYVRVSTREQNEQRQVIALNEDGISGKHIYIRKNEKQLNRTENLAKVINDEMQKAVDNKK